jgi:trimethylamine corrinoid protein
MASDALYEEMTKAVIAGLPDKVRELAKEALRAGLDPMAAIEQGLQPGMMTVGEAFANGEAFIPDLVFAAEAMKAAIAVLEPELMRRKQQRKVLGRVVIGTVEGDIHEIGKTLVGTMLAANGFEVRDLGVDVSAQRFVETAREVNADIVGLSALLTTTMLNQEAVVAALREAGLRERVKVVIGGAPVTREWAREIGADAYAESAIEAVAVVKGVLRA